jgi:hypothetical protein
MLAQAFITPSLLFLAGGRSHAIRLYALTRMQFEYRITVNIAG